MNGALDFLLREAVEAGASDLHLTAGAPPTLRVDGDLRPLDHPSLAPEASREAVYGILSEGQRRRFEEDLELDLSHTLAGVSRFRVNVYRQKGSVGAAFRVVPDEIPELDALGLPAAVRELAERQRGLVLVTGPTGSGKSTTLAAMIGQVNKTRRGHVVSIEDPIEYVHAHGNCIVNQRELGEDTRGFAAALRHALRQDPDVVLVGEMRDLETISLAVTAAETGHLVLSTLHTRDAPGTVDRVVDVFPEGQQAQIRTQLADTLQGVISQTLLPKRGGGRVAACEVLVATPGVRNLIREGKTHQLRSAIQTGARFGMRTMDAALAELVREGTVAPEEAERRSGDPDELRRMLGGATGGARAAGSARGR